MAAESFNSTIAEHQELQITLRDDLARFGIVLCGESLTTAIWLDGLALLLMRQIPSRAAFGALNLHRNPKLSRN